MKSPSISTVIPAYNCERTIAQTIQSVFDQTLKDIEIVVVDDGSKDQTARLARSFANVRYIYQDNAGPAAARNRGAQEAKGEIIFFIDSDCIAEKDWVEKAVFHFQDPHVAVVSGSYGIANPQNILARCVHKEIIFRHRQLMPLRPKSFGSYNFGVRKKVFTEVGGFDQSYRFASGEDNDLSYKIINRGYQIKFEKAALVNHFFPTDFSSYLKEQFRHGFWRVKLYLNHPSMSKGDDYTFWKDIVEIPMTFLLVISLLLSLFYPSFAFFAALPFLTFFVFLEFIFGLIITKDFREVNLLTFVMLTRAFVRTLGFSSGLFYFLSPKNRK